MHEQRAGTDAARMQEMLLDSRDLDSFLARLAAAAQEDLSEQGTAWCSIALTRVRRSAAVGASDERAASVDELQHQAEAGPCTAALRLGRAVRADDLAEDDRWPAYSEVALSVGIRSVLSVPIALEPGAQAVLNCYSEEPSSLDAGASAGAEDFAEVASSPLRLALMIEAERERAADLKAALDSRTAINLATGVVMAQSGCSQEQAVDVLRRASVRRNSKLRHVASQILARFGEECPTTHFD